MRKYIYLIIIGLVFSSCEKFLDITPVGKVIPSSVDEYRALLTSVYNNYPKDKKLAMFRADELEFSFTDPLDWSAYLKQHTWNDQLNDNGSAKYNWQEYYRGIYYANTIIETNGVMEDGSADKKSQILGEAYLLRAYNHFNLVNLFAPVYSLENKTKSAVPLALSTDVFEEPLPKSTLDEVYTQIENDIKEGLKHLKEDYWESNPAYRYRFSILSAKALASRLALYKGEWQKAIDYADEVLAVKPDLQDLVASKSVNPSEYTSVESIQALDYIMDESFAKHQDKNDYMNFTPTTKLINLYHDDDRRKHTYYKDLVSNKWYIKKGRALMYKISFRVGELYLNKAEAYAQLKDAKNARAILFKLLEKRLKSKLFDSEKVRLEAIKDVDLLLPEIYNERYKELAFEGHRWFDLRRTTQEEITHTFDGKTYILKEDDPRYIIPIPLDARLNNKFL